MREAESAKKLADKLYRVHLHGGGRLQLLIHLEVQSQPDADFDERMFVSYYRIFDRYNRSVVCIAVLGDEQADWRPNQYRDSAFETEVILRYPTVKLLDWAGGTAELSASSNPIALVVLSHLESLATNKEPERRRQAKWRLIRRLYELGWTREQFRQMYRLIDWFLELTDELQEQLQQDISAYEKEHHMPYVTSTERMAQEKGRTEGRQEGQREATLTAIALALESRFGVAGEAFARELQAILDVDVDKLTALLRAIYRVVTIEELRVMLGKRDTPI